MGVKSERSWSAVYYHFGFGGSNPPTSLIRCSAIGEKMNKKNRWIVYLSIYLVIIAVVMSCFMIFANDKRQEYTGVITHKYLGEERAGWGHQKTNYWFIVDTQYNLKVSSYKYNLYEIGDSYTWMTTQCS